MGIACSDQIVIGWLDKGWEGMEHLLKNLDDESEGKTI